MKCPNCGYDITDENLICEHCGCEIQIVPDLDFDIESEMKKTMSSIVSDQFTAKPSQSIDDDFDDDPDLIAMLLEKRVGKKTLYVILGIIVAVVVIAAILLGTKVSKSTNYDYQIKMAEEKLASNDILEAVSYLEKAYKIKPNAEILFDIADYYYTVGRENDAIYALIEITEGDFEKTNKESAYKKLITLYNNSQDYQAIGDLLSNCDIQSIIDKYIDFCVFTPEFNAKEGTYEQTIALKISCEGPGNIYYTTDGSIPNEYSSVVDGPVYLEYGSYDINAVYINAYGVSGEVVNKKYLIDVDFVFEPDILTPSGDYEEATLIEAEVPIMYTLFYTTDGTVPDKNSKRYTAPIPMQEGDTTYKFIMYASDGTESTVVERHYNLKLNLLYTPAEAVSALSSYLVSCGSLVDGSHREGVDGTILLMYSAVYPIDGQGTFYFVIEYIEDAYGNRKLTGNKYAVNANDLSVYSVESSDGEYILTRI